MNIVCPPNTCPILLNSKCVFYEGGNLVFLGINTNDNFELVIQKLNNKIQDVVTGDVDFVSIQGDPYNNVLLAQALNEKASVQDLDLKADRPYKELISPVNVNIVGNVVTISTLDSEDIVWKIGNLLYTETSPVTLNVTSATDNFFRKDWIALTTTGIIIITGVESQTVPELPNLLSEQIGLSEIDVFGNIISGGVPIPPVDFSVPSWVVYGNVPFGKYTNGQTVPANVSAYAQYKEAYTNIAPPTYLPPLISLTSTPSTSGLEIGQTVNVNLNLVFTQRDAGSEISRVLNKNGVPLVGNLDVITITQNNVSYQGSVTYAQGAVKNNQVGIPDPTGRINAGTITSGVINYRGDYPLFATSVNITTATKQSLVNMLTANNVQITLVAESGGNKQFFDIPDAWLDVRPLVGAVAFNPLNGQFDVPVNLAQYAVTNVNQVIQGNNVNYKRRTFTGIDRGQVIIRLIF